MKLKSHVDLIGQFFHFIAINLDVKVKYRNMDKKVIRDNHRGFRKPGSLNECPLK